MDRSLAVAIIVSLLLNYVADLGRSSHIEDLERQVEQLNLWIAGHPSEPAPRPNRNPLAVEKRPI